MVKRSLTSFGNAGRVHLVGLSSTQLHVVFQYYTWRDDVSDLCEEEPQQCMSWEKDFDRIALKMYLKAPKISTNSLPERTTYFIRALFYRYNSFADDMSLVDCLTSDAFVALTKMPPTLQTIARRRQLQRLRWREAVLGIENDTVKHCSSNSSRRESSPSRSESSKNV